MSKQTFMAVAGIPLIIVSFLAFLDATFFVKLQNTLNPEQQATNLLQFWWLAFGFIAITGIMYWLIVRDKSEAAALILSSLILIWFGLEDAIFYLIKQIPLELSTQLPWLDNHIILGNIAKSLGFSGVTGASLFVSIGLGLLIISATVPWLLSLEDK